MYYKKTIVIATDLIAVTVQQPYVVGVTRVLRLVAFSATYYGLHFWKWYSICVDECLTLF